jgi:hypothetical protein
MPRVADPQSCVRTLELMEFDLHGGLSGAVPSGAPSWVDGSDLTRWKPWSRCRFAAMDWEVDRIVKRFQELGALLRFVPRSPGLGWFLQPPQRLPSPLRFAPPPSPLRPSGPRPAGPGPLFGAAGASDPRGRSRDGDRATPRRTGDVARPGTTPGYKPVGDSQPEGAGGTTDDRSDRGVCEPWLPSLRKASPGSRSPAIRHAAAQRVADQALETVAIIPAGSVLPSSGGSILASVEEQGELRPQQV